MALFYALITMFVEITMYTASILRDIDAILKPMNRLSKTKNPGELMREHCKDAIILHEQIIRYLLDRFCNEFIFIEIFFHISDVRLNLPWL